MKILNLKQWARKIRKRERASSDSYICYLREKGARIGEDVCIYAVNNSRIDETSAYLLTIGNHVRITEGVTILTHDYAWSVLKSGPEQSKGSILGAQSPVSIGNNVFVGVNSTIMRGVKIGDNVIIGAGSVVTKDCPSNGVYAGNPAKFIMSIEEYYKRRSDCQFLEAKRVAIQYRERFGKNPPREIFDEYFALFATADEAAKCEAFRKKMELLNGFADTVRYMDAHPPQFADYESFLMACYEEEMP